MYGCLPIRFDRVTAFIVGYTLAVEDVRGASPASDVSAFRPAAVKGHLQEQLREEGKAAPEPLGVDHRRRSDRLDR